MEIKSTTLHNPARIYRYYDDEWRSGRFTCPECAWTGTRREMSGPNMFSDLADYECPRCEKMLLIVGYPTRAETREAAANGNPEALRNLGGMSGEYDRRRANR